MLAFLHPLGSLFTGLALAAFGAFYSVLRHPPASALQVLAQAMPDAIAVLIFGIGIAPIVVGIILLVSGIRGIRSRTREISRAYGSGRVTAVAHTARNTKPPGTTNFTRPTDSLRLSFSTR